MTLARLLPPQGYKSTKNWVASGRGRTVRHLERLSDKWSCLEKRAPPSGFKETEFSQTTWEKRPAELPRRDGDQISYLEKGPFSNLQSCLQAVQDFQLIWASPRLGPAFSDATVSKSFLHPHSYKCPQLNSLAHQVGLQWYPHFNLSLVPHLGWADIRSCLPTNSVTQYFFSLSQV